jgi:predicted esterase YcpF (UPF0227 family)
MVDLNPPFGDAAYQPFGVFPASELARGLGRRVLVVLHGFLSAIPNGYYKRLRAAFGDGHDVIGVNYAYFEPDETIRGLDDLARVHLDGRHVAAFGPSLGGFWAAHFARRIGAERLILVNPATRPADTLGRMIGQTVFAERRQQEIVVTAEMVARYDAVGDIPVAGSPTLVLLAREIRRRPHGPHGGVPRRRPHPRSSNPPGHVAHRRVPARRHRLTAAVFLNDVLSPPS